MNTTATTIEVGDTVKWQYRTGWAGQPIIEMTGEVLEVLHWSHGDRAHIRNTHEQYFMVSPSKLIKCEKVTP